MSTKTASSDHAAPVPTAPSTMQRWFPIGAWLPQYNWSGFLKADLIAAVSVAALLIPESMGYSSVAGVPVQIGLYAAPLALVGYALFGGSKLLVNPDRNPHTVATRGRSAGFLSWYSRPSELGRQFYAYLNI